jgi:hypothetical protein
VVLVLEQQDLQGRVAVVLDRGPGRLDHLVGGAGVDHAHGPDGPAHPAAQQLPHRHPEPLTPEVPQRLVHRGERPGHGHAAEAVGPVQGEPVVLDVQRVLAPQVAGEGPDHLGHGRGPGEVRGLPDAGQAVVGGDPGVARPAGREGLD